MAHFLKAFRLGISVVVMLWAGLAEGAEGRLIGLMFGDYYYVLKGAKRDQNGFQFRRIYLTYNLKWNDQFSGRLRFEAKDSGFGSGGKMEPFVKHAYLKYAKSSRSIYLGLSGTPTWSVSESVWGYRSVHKTLMDWTKVGSSTDTGIAFQGKLDESGKVNLHLMVGNGTGTNSENDNRKKVYLHFHLNPSDQFQATGGIDWEKRARDQDRLTFSAFVAGSGSALSIGLEGFLRINKNQFPGSNVQLRGLSLFGRGAVAEKAFLFGRVDLFDPSDQAGNDQEYLFIGGLDLMPHPDIHIIPNLVATAYQASGVESNVMPRVTVFFKF